ncbi:MAG: hypothetical protein K0R69_735 [Clostridia bacterium]|jgi:hypothetical protein|nr:hypothetical protein [Clostridia bacterium]
MISNLFSRKIVAWEDWEVESAGNASELVHRAIISEKLTDFGSEDCGFECCCVS